MLSLLSFLILAAGPDSTAYSGNQGELAPRPPRLEQPRIEVDGVLDEAEWSQAVLLDGFTQYEPVEGGRVREETEVLVFYTQDAIYFGIRALDSSPSEIQATLAERDRSVFNDDWIRLMLDTFDDQRQAYVFYVNPYGIQTDGLWVEGLVRGEGGPPIPIDFSPDFIWDSEARVTPDGWVAEIRIPFVSLRFPSDRAEQSWGFNVAREVKRLGFKDSWAPLTQNNPSTLAQSGRLVGLHDIRPKRLVEVNPVVTGKRTGELTGGRYVHSDFDPEFGFNTRVGITQNLVLDATVNPDFSQVEADAGQLTVNERFAVFFPEKRPFFLEGMELFNTPQRLVHTRQIIDPIGGMKLTGKVGAVGLGYLGALDESPITIGSGGARAAFNLLRARSDIGSGSTVGVLYTDRTLTDGSAYNRVAGADARILFGGRYSFSGQLAQSWTRTTTDETLADPLVSATLSRSGRTWGWDLRFLDVAPGFRARTGFIPRTGDAQLLAQTRVSTYGAPGAWLERASAELRFDSFFKHDELWGGGSPDEFEIELQPTANFRGGHSIFAIVRDGYFRFTPADYAGYAVRAADGTTRPFVVPHALEHMLGVAFFPRFRLSSAANANGRIYLREIPIYVEASRGFEVQLAPELRLRPTPALSLELDYTYSRIWRSADESVFSTANIARARVQYQFTESIFARALGQYNMIDRAALADPRTGEPLLSGGSPLGASESGDFQSQLLLSYAPSPGTIFYVGWSQLLSGPEASYRLGAYEREADGLFIKLSYLFRY